MDFSQHPRRAQLHPMRAVTPELQVALDQWKGDLTNFIAEDGAEDSPYLTIGAAHPGGLAQLYAEHPTRLTNLVRESVSQAKALESAAAIIQRSSTLTSQHGVGPVHMAIGRASWNQGGQRITTAALLRPVRVEKIDDEVTLTLLPGTILAPLLADSLAECGTHLDVAEVVSGATTVHGFSSSRALAILRDAAAVLDGFTMSEELIVGVFQHPADSLLQELEAAQAIAQSGVVQALAGNTEALEELRSELPAANPYDRDPWVEKGAGDLSPSDLDIIEAISAGRSIIVNAPDFDDSVRIVGAALADAAASGRKALYIAGSASRREDLEQYLSDIDLEEIALPIDGATASTQTTRARLGFALTNTQHVSDLQAVNDMRGELVSLRSLLNEHMIHLHRPYKSFGVSAFDALQVLTDLTGATPKPRTKVRLREEVLLAIAADQGVHARELLHRASALGIFARSNDHAVWRGIVINTVEQVPQIMARLKRLHEETLPSLKRHMTATAQETGIRPATSMHQWSVQLEMFEGVRDVLDVFQPRIFDRSAADFVIATASPYWRREHGVTMSGSQRRRLVKQAKELLRPGVHVEDLHKELLKVQDRREVWRNHCDADGWPILPQKIDEALGVTYAVREDLDALAPIFATSHPDLLKMSLAELSHLFARLLADPMGAQEMPNRVAVLKELQDLGLGALTKDLISRHVPDEVLDAELDLAWWASILGQMISAEPRLGGFNPAHLEESLLRACELDRDQVRSLSDQVKDRLRALRRDAMMNAPAALTDLQQALSGSDASAQLYSRYPMARELQPVVLTSPAVVPWILPLENTIDLLILDGVDAVPLAELIPIIARAQQVVGVADMASAREGGIQRTLAQVLPVSELKVAPSRLNDHVALLLARHGMAHTGVPVPWTSSSASVTAVWVDGKGMPAPGVAAVESSSEEVRALVDLVIEQATEFPDRSLMVVALNALHAGRIQTELSKVLAHEVGLAEFFSEDKAEPFVVVDPTQVGTLSRDHVIVSVGFAKTPHGRVIHDFGLFSTADGAGLMRSILSSVRDQLTIVSSVQSGDIDRSRITVQGAQMLVDLLELVGEHSGVGVDSWPTLEAQPDRLLVDLADRLYRLGLEVVPNVGIPGGVRIPLAIGHPEVPGRLLVAVLTDDLDYVSEPSQRQRDRRLPEILRQQGWTVHTVLSMPVFIDPAKEASRIVDIVLDAVDGVHAAQEQAQHDAGFADSDVDIELSGDGELLELDTEEKLSELVDAPVVDVSDENSAETGAGAEDVAEAPEVQPQRAPRPMIAAGLPLAAYTDDQLDELAAWVRSDGIARSFEELVEEMRHAVGLRKAGAQSDAVLGNVIRRTGNEESASQ